MKHKLIITSDESARCECGKWELTVVGRDEGNKRKKYNYKLHLEVWAQSKTAKLVTIPHARVTAERQDKRMRELRRFNDTYQGVKPLKYARESNKSGSTIECQYFHLERITAKGRLVAMVRYDDNCHNGHETFSLTGEWYGADANRRGYRREPDTCGCIHERIAEVMPEMIPAIKWHLTDSAAPLHYLANTLYFAGTTDYNGREKGEPYGFETVVTFGGNPIVHTKPSRFVKWLEESRGHNERGRFDFEILRIDHENSAGDTYKFGPKYTFGGYAAEWYQCPFDTEHGALNFLHALQRCDPKFTHRPTRWGEGKERELDAARRAAVWLDAPDSVMCLPKEELRGVLEARHPALMAEFKAFVLGLGFRYRNADGTVEYTGAGAEVNS